MKYKLRIIIILSISSLVPILILLYAYNSFVNRPNHFYRNFYDQQVAPVRMFNLNLNSFYFSGVSGTGYLLGNETEPMLLVVVDSSLSKVANIQLINETNYPIKSSSIEVSDSILFVNDQISRIIYIGRTEKWSIDIPTKNNRLVDAMVPISATSAIIRTLKDRKLEYTLAKESFNPLKINFSDSILKKQTDGMFSCDGKLLYDATVSKLVYVYFYRNEIACIDTNMNLIYRAHTIDTISMARINVSLIKSDHMLTLSSPPLLVNKACCLYKGCLYINSALKADNESSSSFKSSFVIDVYDLKQGAYRSSFYLKKYIGKDIKDFKIINNMLIALSGTYLLEYPIPISTDHNSVNKSNIN